MPTDGDEAGGFDVVVVAAGRSERFGEQDKLFVEIEGHPLIEYTLARLRRAIGVGRLVVVASESNLAKLQGLADGMPGENQVVRGGARRRDSVEAGLRACETEYAAIHDGARPLVTPALIERCVAAARGRAGAIAAIPVTDTIKEVAGGMVVASPDRRKLWAAQTPQVVRRDLWLEAAALDDADETDDAAMLARLGVEVAVVEGEPWNLKVTRPEDVAIVRAYLASGR